MYNFRKSVGYLGEAFSLIFLGQALSRGITAAICVPLQESTYEFISTTNDSGVFLRCVYHSRQACTLNQRSATHKSRDHHRCITVVALNGVNTALSKLHFVANEHGVTVSIRISPFSQMHTTQQGKNKVQCPSRVPRHSKCNISCTFSIT